jgi:large subunit ribosomal protein L15
MPKRGFNNAQFRTTFAEVNLSDLDGFEAGSEVTVDLLRAAGLVRGKVDGVKLLAGGKLSKALKVSVHRASAAARLLVEKAGGSVVLVG